MLTVLSGWKLRQTRPEWPRSFVVPGGNGGLLYVVWAPVLMAIVALFGGDLYATIGGAISLLLGPVIYLLVRLRRRLQPA